MLRRIGYDQRFAYLALLPALLLIAAIMIYPIMYAFGMSFQRTNGATSTFVGLNNYINLLRDPTLYRVLANNVVFLIMVPLILISSLICAVLIYEEAWGWKFFRVLFFLPSVISTAIIGVLFRTLFSYEGPANQLLGLMGRMPVDWLASRETAITVIVIALVWSSFGYGMLVLLAGMAGIDPSLYEAARLDGATWTQRVRFITVPLLKRPLQFLTLINIIYTFTSLFGFIYVMTSGGPGYDTTTLDYFIYLKAFTGSDLGGGSALAFILFGITLVLAAVQFRLGKVADEEA